MAETDAAALYMDNCASCHSETRLGGMGPALIPESLARKTPETTAEIIKEGSPATKMPAFGETLTGDEIAALTEFVHSPLAEAPVWGVAEIAASRVIFRFHTACERTPICSGSAQSLRRRRSR